MLLPEHPFFFFGMGNRVKLFYHAGRLCPVQENRPIFQWEVAKETIIPEEYRVELRTVKGTHVTIFEDEHKLAVTEDDRTTVLSEGEIVLPSFEANRHTRLLCILHQEMLFHLYNGMPLPNLFVYGKPWYRDAAMVAMCLQKTGNLHLIRDWVLSLAAPYDCNNAGHCEPDNLGQALYLISTVSDASHPLVPVILQEANRIQKNGHLCGMSDFAPHSVYQTKWLKYGLSQLSLPDQYKIPDISDSYDALFWWDYQDQRCPTEKFDANTVRLYPYLGWAQAHFYRDAPPMDLLNPVYPLTWECEASQANYEKLNILSNSYVERRYSPSHTWHAAEAFLYLYEHGKRVG